MKKVVIKTIYYGGNSRGGKKWKGKKKPRYGSAKKPYRNFKR